MLVLVGCFVMAQKTSTVIQSGNGNIATVLQNSTDGDLNAIYGTQSGDYNALTTEQRGNNNYIELLQSGNHNVATMEQYTGGTAPNLNNALITESGNLNKATLTQKEDPLNFPDNSHNVSTASQSGDYNNFVLNQGGNEWNPLNESSLKQNGNNNIAAIDQFGYTDVSDIKQFGNYNKANLTQTAGQGGAGTATSTSFQQGTSNDIDILQDYDPLSQYASSVQNGTNNSTSIKQMGNGSQTVVSQQLGTDVIDIQQIGF